MRVKISVKVPKDYLKDINFQSIIARKQRNTTVPEVLKMFNQTVEGWKNKPGFGYNQIINSRRVQVTVGPKGIFGGNNSPLKIYRWVTLGTDPHPITARRKRGFLSFQHGKGYHRSTIPGTLLSSSNSNTGAPVIIKSVNHSGIKEPRLFHELIAREYEQKFRDDMQDAVNEAVNE